MRRSNLVRMVSFRTIRHNSLERSMPNDLNRIIKISYGYLCLKEIGLSFSKLHYDEVYSIHQYVVRMFMDFSQDCCFRWFLPQINWSPRYSWRIVEVGVKHHNPIIVEPYVSRIRCHTFVCLACMWRKINLPEYLYFDNKFNL